jgi:hypothetical protein
LYNILVEWETGETTYEPLELIADDPANNKVMMMRIMLFMENAKVA